MTASGGKFHSLKKTKQTNKQTKQNKTPCFASSKVHLSAVCMIGIGGGGGDNGVGEGG